MTSPVKKGRTNFTPGYTYFDENKNQLITPQGKKIFNKSILAIDKEKLIVLNQVYHIQVLDINDFSVKWELPFEDERVDWFPRSKYSFATAAWDYDEDKGYLHIEGKFFSSPDDQVFTKFLLSDGTVCDITTKKIIKPKEEGVASIFRNKHEIYQVRNTRTGIELWLVNFTRKTSRKLQDLHVFRDLAPLPNSDKLLCIMKHRERTGGSVEKIDPDKLETNYISNFDYGHHFFLSENDYIEHESTGTVFFGDWKSKNPFNSEFVEENVNLYTFCPPNWFIGVNNEENSNKLMIWNFFTKEEKSLEVKEEIKSIITLSRDLIAVNTNENSKILVPSTLEIIREIPDAYISKSIPLRNTKEWKAFGTKTLEKLITKVPTELLELVIEFI